MSDDNIMNVPYTTCNICLGCQSTMNSIGTSKHCVICFMKIACKSNNCSNIGDGSDGYCKTCNVIQTLKIEIYQLKKIVKNYEDRDNTGVQNMTD